jgi:hypothetical protein
MNKITLAITLIIFVLFLCNPTVQAESRIIGQKVIYCESGALIYGETVQGERVEASLQVLLSEEKELHLFTELIGSVFYLEDEKISENSSLLLTLPIGTHTIRVIGTVPMGYDKEELTILGSDSLGRYITATIVSPYILKNTAYFYILITSVTCTILAASSVFITTKGKIYRMKTGVTKKSDDNKKKTRTLILRFLEKTAPNLTLEQRKAAKELVKEFDEL